MTPARVRKNAATTRYYSSGLASGFVPRTANPKLYEVETYQPGKPIEEVCREMGIKKAVKLASNESPFGCSPMAVKAVNDALPRIHRYPDAACYELRRSLSRHLDIEPERIVFGNGSDELIVMAIRAFVSPDRGDEVMTASPTFLVYRIASQVHGCRLTEIPMKDHRYDLPRMLKAARPSTRLIFIANPDNPVGTYLRERELSDFLSRLPQKTLVFLDEAYYEYAQFEEGYPRSLTLLERHPNLILSRTFSKAYGLSGLRVGYVLAHKKVADALQKVREPFNVNSLAQAAASASLKDRKFLKAVVSQTRRERGTLARELKKAGFQVIPSAANFVTFKAGTRAEPIYQELMKRGVIIRWLKFWGLPEFLRVTVGTPSENRQFLAELKRLRR